MVVKVTCKFSERKINEEYIMGNEKKISALTPRLLVVIGALPLTH